MGAFSEGKHMVNIKGLGQVGCLLQPFIKIPGREADNVHPDPYFLEWDLWRRRKELLLKRSP